MKRNVGSTFVHNGKKYVVKQVPWSEVFCCTHCAFKSRPNCSYLQENVTGECEGESRGDNVNVYFEEIV